jgi:hypothetical protein
MKVGDIIEYYVDSSLIETAVGALVTDKIDRYGNFQVGLTEMTDHSWECSAREVEQHGYPFGWYIYPDWIIRNLTETSIDNTQVEH